MFFINPTIITNLPIGNVVQEKAGYAVYLILFITVIGLATLLMYYIETSIYKLVKKKQKA
jgi:peptidoglycan/LPS O-acetylase OafA/YrhL